MATVRDKYDEGLAKALARPSAIIEKEGYLSHEGRTKPARDRLTEVIAFAKRIEATSVGMAFCMGLKREARAIASVLRDHDIVVESVQCKCGAIDKCDLGLPKEVKLGDCDAFEAACNPVLQAELLNEAGTTFNLVVGLCIGHDMLFTHYSKAPVSTLIVKDRQTGHNPLAAVYSAYHHGKG
jgi:uncharacterized metal-binding protein